MNTNCSDICGDQVDILYHSQKRIHKQGHHCYIGSTAFTNTENNRDETPIDIEVLPSADDARQYAERLWSIDHKNVQRHYMTGYGERQSVLLLESTRKSLRKWAKTKNLRIWKYNTNRDIILCMGCDFIDVFKGIAAGLQTLILFHGSYHGNLKKGVRISPDGKAKLVDLVPFENMGDIEENIKKDIGDFKKLVRFVVKSHPPENQCKHPVALNLFNELCDEAIALNGKDLWDHVFFIINNALFFDGLDRYNFVEKIWDYKKFNLGKFDISMDMECDGLACMAGWRERVGNRKDTYEGLYGVLTYNLIREKLAEPHGIIDFHHHSYFHYTDYVDGGCPRLVTDECLLDVLPDAIPKMFYKLVNTVLKDATCYKQDLVEFMQLEPYALPQYLDS